LAVPLVATVGILSAVYPWSTEVVRLFVRVLVSVTNPLLGLLVALVLERL